MALGVQINKNGLSIDPAKHLKIKSFSVPKNIKQVQVFLDMVGFCRNFIQNYADVAESLFNLLKKSKQFVWTERETQAMQNIVELIRASLIVAYPDLGETLYVYTDASTIALSVVLTQKILDKRLIYFVSRKLTSVEMWYSMHERELLATIFASIC